MTIRLKPELEALIQKAVGRGPYQSADEFVEQAVQMLHEQERGLRTTIQILPPRSKKATFPLSAEIF